MDVPRHGDEPGAGRAPAPASEILADRPLTEPHSERLSPDDPAYPQIVRVHADALAAGADTYIDPGTGYTVLTAGYLARRGHCCESGCRHCPYVT
jgi:Family of unknown function (DUF5522)